MAGMLATRFMDTAIIEMIMLARLLKIKLDQGVNKMLAMMIGMAK
jgi:hypothetical protein